MKCPHCRTDEPEGAAECPRCGFVYAKWRSPRAADAPPPVLRPQEESSQIVLWGGLAAAVLAYIFFFRAAPPPPIEAPRQAAAGPAPAMAAEPVPEGWWRLEGVVLDLSRTAPVAGARAVLNPGGAQALTDADGRFQFAAAPLEDGSFVLDISHTALQPQYLSGTRDDVLMEYQARNGCPRLLEREELRPRAGELVRRVYGVCPRR